MTDPHKRMLGQYELRELIGSGGMGSVYRAYQPSLRREVAIKVLGDTFVNTPGYVERFTREAQIAASLNHPNVVTIYDFGVEARVPFIAMTLLRGATLADRVKYRLDRQEALPSLAEAIDLLRQIGSALDYAHGEGVIHRDVKPSNIMFDTGGRPYLVDFGIAKLKDLALQLTPPDTAMGSLAFMAPEQCRGEALTPAADQYSLALVAYYMLTGRPAFEGTSPYALMHKQVNETPASIHLLRPELPESASQPLQRALSKTPSERYPSCTEFAEAYRAAVEGDEGQSTGFFSFKLRTTSVEGRPITGTRSGRLAPPTDQDVPFYQKPIFLGIAIGVAAFIVGLLLLWSITGTSVPPLGQTATSLVLNQTMTAMAAANSPTDTPTSPPVIITVAPPTSPPTATQTPTVTPTVTPTLTPTLTPTPTQTPTEVPSVTPSRTATPRPTATDSATPDAPAILANSEALIYDGPGTGYPILGAVHDQTPELLGRNAQTTWLLVITAQGQQGWLPIGEITVQGSIAALPVVSASPSPSDTPRPSATPTPTASLTRTPTATPTPTPSPTRTPTATWTQRPTATATPTRLATATGTPNVSPSPSTASPTPAQGTFAIKVTVTRAILRSGPSQTAPMIANVPNGAIMQVVSQIGEGQDVWYLVASSPHQEVWISARTVHLYPDTLTQAHTANVAVSAANLRHEPSQGSAVITTLARGTLLVIVARTRDAANPWYLVELPDASMAWVWGNTLDLDGTQTPICGDAVCGADWLLHEPENGAHCPVDCACGDGICDLEESSGNLCEADCKLGYCGDGICDRLYEWNACLTDCPR